MRYYYLAYGSNLSLSQMAHRCPDAYPVGTAALEGYRLNFRGSGSGAYLTIDEDETNEVPCVVWAISEDDEKRLDRYEGYPAFYKKFEVEVEVYSFIEEDATPYTVTALVYALPECSPQGKPSMDYVQTCFEGYRRFRLSSHAFKAALDQVFGVKAARIWAQCRREESKKQRWW